MPRHGKQKSKNYGYGNDPKYATKNALQTHFGGGHFQTVSTHCARSNLFYDWLHSEHGICDARKITNEIFMGYALYLKLLRSEEEISPSTAINRISSVNVFLKIIRGDECIRIDEIANTLEEKRCYIRRSAPDGIEIQQVDRLRSQLITAGYNRAAAVVWLARATGMRLRECILSDISRLLREAKNLKKINIQDGCKGGRSGAFAPRWLSVTDEIISALEYAQQVSPDGSENLLAPSETYIKFLRREIDAARPLMQINGIKGPHELRAAFACERYMQLVGIPAPVFPRPEIISGQYFEAIRLARQIISRELGHERPEITNSYIGSERR